MDQMCLMARHFNFTIIYLKSKTSSIDTKSWMTTALGLWFGQVKSKENN